MEELLGSLFILYILGSIVAGFFRRGAGSQGPGQSPTGGPGRPGLPELLDMDELERRLREIRSGTREPDEAMAPSVSVRETESASVPESVSSTQMSSASLAPSYSDRQSPTQTPSTELMPPFANPQRPAVRVGGWDSADAEDWDDLPGDDWGQVSEPKGPRSSDQTKSRLPAAVVTFIDEGKPWQAAFVIKELLGPPRALQPHRRRPPF